MNSSVWKKMRLGKKQPPKRFLLKGGTPWAHSLSFPLEGECPHEPRTLRYEGAVGNRYGDEEPLSSDTVKSVSDLVDHRRSGFIIPVILFVVAIGILLGISRLMMFKLQCQERFVRQDALDRTLATRSALGFIESTIRNIYAQEETNHFVYVSGSGKKIDVTVRPVERLLDSDLLNGWVPIADAGSEITPPLDEVDTSGSKVAFHFSAVNETNAICVQGMDIGTTWLDYPWGLRFLVQPGVPYIGLENIPHTHTHLQLYIVGGELSEAGLSKEDLNQNPVIRIDVVPAPENEATPSTLKVYYSEDGAMSINADNPIMSDDGGDWGRGFGVQINGNRISLFERTEEWRALQFWDFATFDEAVLEQFDYPLRLYVGAQQVAEPETALHYSIQQAEVRPPYEWEIELEWTDSKGVRMKEIATVVHAVDSSGAGRQPDITITYDTHGTEAKW